MIYWENFSPEYPKKKRKLAHGVPRHVASDEPTATPLLAKDPPRPAVLVTSRLKPSTASVRSNSMLETDGVALLPRETEEANLLQQCLLDASAADASDALIPAIGRCSSSSSLSEAQNETCSLDNSYYVVTEARSPPPCASGDTSLRKTYAMTRRRSLRRSLSDDRMQPPLESTAETPPSPSLGLRMMKSIDISKQRFGEIRQRLPSRQDRSKWLIPADHPYKVAWDMLTVILSCLGAYATHASIRDRSFHRSGFVFFCEIWFLVDILLNFVTEHKTSAGLVIRDGKTVWARYLTTWFVVDALSLVPWESLYVKPLIDMQNRRSFFKKAFFRSRAVIRVTRVLRGRHFRLFGQVASHTKHAGVGANRLLRLLIKYAPKYLLFYRNMKAVLAVRTLRQVHWFRKVMKSFLPQKDDDDTYSLSEEESEDRSNADKNDEDIYVFEYRGAPSLEKKSQ